LVAEVNSTTTLPTEAVEAVGEEAVEEAAVEEEADQCGE
jgi:hypothetical protein